MSALARGECPLLWPSGHQHSVGTGLALSGARRRPPPRRRGPRRAGHAGAHRRHPRANRSPLRTASPTPAGAYFDRRAKAAIDPRIIYAGRGVVHLPVQTPPPPARVASMDHPDCRGSMAGRPVAGGRIDVGPSCGAGVGACGWRRVPPGAVLFGAGVGACGRRTGRGLSLRGGRRLGAGVAPCEVRTGRAVSLRSSHV